MYMALDEMVRIVMPIAWKVSSHRTPPTHAHVLSRVSRNVRNGAEL